MTPSTRPAWFAAPLLAAAGLLTTAPPARAGWDNVFQVCCHDCRPKPARSYYAPPDACPPQQKVEYQQRCYYEPITVMKPTTVREEVPIQVKSYYWDPVTSYSYTSYYDPCTGCSQKIAVPKTCYVRKESCSTVMRYVERIQMVPTQVNRKVCETRPVVTYYGPTTKTYDCPTCELPQGGGAAAPRVDELRTNPPAVAPDGADRIPPPNIPTSPNSLPRSMPPARPYTGGVNSRTTARTAAPVRGEVVQNDQSTPRPGAKLVFVSAADTAVREYATADGFGNFDLKLPAGDWYVYIGTGDGRAVLHKKITIAEYDAREFKVVSR